MSDKGPAEIFSGIFAEGGNFFRLPSVYPGKRSILPEAPTLTKERKIIYEIFCEADRSGSMRRRALCPCTGSRDTINSRMRSILDEATDPWGIKVNRVELKNIIPPKEIQNAMEKQMKAERERRESILQAEGQKQSQILVAEGEKQSAILRADAAKQAKIMEAEAEKTAKILAAEAESEAIMKVQQATADALKLLNEAAPNDQVVKLKALETMTKVADGKATKIIIPSEIQGMAGLAASVKELVKE